MLRQRGSRHDITLGVHDVRNDFPVRAKFWPPAVDSQHDRHGTGWPRVRNSGRADIYLWTA